MNRQTDEIEKEWKTRRRKRENDADRMRERGK
jgi:hypothetical protein